MTPTKRRTLCPWIGHLYHPSYTMSLQSLPNELLLRIADNFQHSKDVYSLLQTNRRFARVLIPVLNRRAIRSENAMIALFWAAVNQQEAVVKLLLQRGNQVEVIMKDPAHWANRTLVHKGPGNCTQTEIRFVLDQGANLVLRDKCRQSLPALHYAIRNGHVALFRLLLEKGAFIEARDDFDLTPLHEAAWQGKEMVVKLLLERGADVAVRDFMGRTPLHMAVEYKHEGTMRLLCEKGADVTLQDHQQRTPLHIAVKIGDERVVRCLLEEGADVTAEDHLRRTPFQMACPSVLQLMDIIIKGDEERYGWPGRTLWQMFPLVLRRLKRREYQQKMYYLANPQSVPFLCGPVF